MGKHLDRRICESEKIAGEREHKNMLFHPFGINNIPEGEKGRKIRFNMHTTDTSVKRSPRVGPCLSLFPLFVSL